MQVTRVYITDPDPGESNGLVAGVAVEIDGSVLIRNMRLVARKDGSLLVDFPSEMLFDRCGGCGRKVKCVASFCDWCGVPHEPWDRPNPETNGRRSNFINVVHPTNSTGRTIIETAVFAAYRRHKSRQQESQEAQESK